MSKKLYHADVKAMLASGEYTDASEIIDERCPKARRKFNALCKSMKAYLDEIKRDFPDANYYTGSGGFNLILGHTHGNGDASEKPNQDLCAFGAMNGLAIGDGGW